METPHLSRREWETLERLLAGDSEKQVARRLHLSRHTVHTYVKSLYLKFGAQSRAELLSRFIATASTPPPPPGIDPFQVAAERYMVRKQINKVVDLLRQAARLLQEATA